MAGHGSRVTSRDVPGLIDILEGTDDEAQCGALRDLCPCRNRRYDREVWVAILRTFADSPSPAVRDAAHHAIDTLRERARKDPRTQELVGWLTAHEPALAAALRNTVPVWYERPRLPRGLVVPRFERSHRSRKNKPK